MNDREYLRSKLVEPKPLAPEALYQLALDALDHELCEEIVARIEAALSDGNVSNKAGLYHILGLARRGLLDGAEAHAAFSCAAALVPQDKLFAHAMARSAWEAGLPATALYRRAIRLSPNDAGILLGHAASLLADGRGGEAKQSLADLLVLHPGWQEGHAAYARTNAGARDGGDGTTTVRAALTRFPSDRLLWRTLLRLLLDDRRYDEAGEAVASAVRQFGPEEEWLRVKAISLSETGRPIEAQHLFDRLSLTNQASALVHPIRNLIRLDRLQDAAELAEQTFAPAEERVLWPYRALLWRAIGDPRWEWLEGDERLIGEYQIASAAELAPLADMLRGLHRHAGEMTGQSIQGGSQTDGQLLARAAPVIRWLRDRLLDAVLTHVARLPPPVQGHPTLIERRAPLRITGSWSVRLTDAGFHTDHVHPHGWLSSAFYVAVPDQAMHTAEDGWLAFGECNNLLPESRAFRTIRPRVGRLVLFPSTMWHGTRPFTTGERISVAFDIAPPAIA